MNLLTSNQKTTQRDFVEIYELLPAGIFDKAPEERFGLQLKFRALGVLLLSLIFDKRFHILWQEEIWRKIEDKNIIEGYERMLIEAKAAFTRMLAFNKIREVILKVGERYSVRYLDFFEKVFVMEKELSWNDVIGLLIPPKKKE
jgi:hypothetical protein